MSQKDVTHFKLIEQCIKLKSMSPLVALDHGVHYIGCLRVEKFEELYCASKRGPGRYGK